MKLGRAGERVLRLLIRRAGTSNLRKLFMLWLLELRHAPTRDALRTMLTLEEDLGGQLDRAAIELDGGVHAKHRLTGYHDFFVDRIGQGERVLDVGCGKGELAHDVAQRARAHVVGIDTNADYLRFARARFSHERLRFVEADAAEYEPDEPADVVILSNVLEHIDDRAHLLRGLVRRARPQRMLFRVPMRNRDWKLPLRRELGLEHLGPGHFVEYDEPLFRAELEQAGLAVRELIVNWGELWAVAEPDPPGRRASGGAH